MKSGQSRKTLLLALLLASAAAVVAFFYLNSRQGSNAAAPPVAPTAVPTTPVLVAKADIPVNTQLTLDLFEVKQVPADLKQPHALTSPDQALGKVSTAALVRGEQLLDTRVADQSTKPDSLARKVPVGKRAISIVFDEVMGTGGLVQPGDHVDVIGFFEVELKAPKQQGGSSAPEPAFVVGADGAKLLEQPDNSASVIAELDPGTEVTVLSAEGRYFRVKVGDQTGWLDAMSISAKDDGQGTGGGTSEFKTISTSHVATYIVQDVEVLAVSQAVSPDEAGVAQPGSTRTDAKDSTADAKTATADATSAAGDKAGNSVARPTAKSVTLAVTPEEAQRLLLAAQVTEDKQIERNIGIRLVVRAPGDDTIANLPPAELGPLPIGNALAGVNQPLFPSELVITDVQFTQRVLNAGQVLEFKATIKNISDHPIRGAKTAPPEFTYAEGTAYDTLGFTPEIDTYRIGLNVSNAFPTQFPYRWGLGRDLKPGETTTVVGSVQLTNPTPATTYWFGVLHEPEIVTQDGVAVADVTVLVPNTVTVDRNGTPLLADANAGAEVVATLAQGQQLAVTQVRGGWFRAKAGQKEGWIPIAAVRVPSPADEPPAAAAPQDAGPRGFDIDALNPWNQKETKR